MFANLAALSAQNMQMHFNLPSINTSNTNTHPNNMKSQQILSKSSIFSAPQRRVGKSFAVMFAAALALGMSAQSLLAQGSYYPQTIGTGGAPFEPNGVPVTSDPNLNAIEVKLGILSPLKTLIVPFPTGKTAASAAEYAAAVKAVATDLANGVVFPGASLNTLAAEVAKYRSSQVADALGAIADGVIASGSGTKAAQLNGVASAAAAANPTQIGSANFALFLNKIAANAALNGDVDTIVASVLNGAVSTSLGASALQPTSVNTLLLNAILAQNAGPGTNAAKKLLIEDIGSAAVAAIVAAPALNSAPNLDQATAALTIPSATVNLNDMILKITSAVGAPTTIQLGAIAVGALRNPVNQNPASYLTIKTAVGGAYATDLVDSFAVFNVGAPGNATGLVTGGKDAAAVAAAGSLKFPGSAGAIVKDSLIAAASGVPAVRQNIVARAAASSQSSALAIATANAAGFGGATPADIVAGAITGGQIKDAGVISKAVVNIPANLAAPGPIATAAIDAAEAASPVTRDAYADIAYNMAFVLKLAGGVGDARSSAATTAMVNALNSGADSFIPVIAALAGNGGANASAIKGAGLAADLVVNAGANATPINDGAALTASLLGFGPYNPTASYHATLTALALTPTQTTANDLRNRALLYAASLGNSTDAVAGLAAAIKETGVSAATLTQDAISANRSKQSGLSVASEVAVYMKLNGLAGTNIQAFIGEKLLANPTLVSDIATAGTVVIPNFANFISHAVAFHTPSQAYQSVATIINHSQISRAGVLALGDRPAAIAAITAGTVTGIIENRDLSVTDKRNALRDAVRSTVQAVVSTSYNSVSAIPFRRSDGTPGGFSVAVPANSKGVAGAITGFVAQTTQALDTTVTLDVTTALQAAAAAVGSGGFNYDIAQAAGQAFGWVSGAANAAAVAAPGQAADLIAAAIFAGYGVGPTNTYAAIRNAVDFGLNEAAGGTGLPGAGARGLSSVPGLFYQHKSASGVPVSNIFTL